MRCRAAHLPEGVLLRRERKVRHDRELLARLDRLDGLARQGSAQLRHVRALLGGAVRRRSLVRFSPGRCAAQPTSPGSRVERVRRVIKLPRAQVGGVPERGHRAGEGGVARLDGACKCGRVPPAKPAKSPKCALKGAGTARSGAGRPRASLRIVIPTLIAVRGVTAGANAPPCHAVRVLFTPSSTRHRHLRLLFSWSSAE